MAIFTGTSGADEILREALSPGVVTDPSGLGGTATGESNLIRAGRGADLIQAGDSGDEIYGGGGDDRIYGGAGYDVLHGGRGSDLLVGGDTSGWGVEILDGGAGADRMIGGSSIQFYIVDSYLDVAIDLGAGEDWDFGDAIVTNLDYKLSETAGIESLDFLSARDFGLGGGARIGIGNSHDNTLLGNDRDNALSGRAGADVIQGWTGDDLVSGGRGDDDVQGNDGRDVVRGQGGADNVWGGAGWDLLIGGRGEDTFFFNYATDSGPGQIDRIVAGDRAEAFEGAGEEGGDIIWLPNATAPDPWIPFNGPWIFGETGEGGVSCVDRRGDTLVRGNIDGDADFEFLLLIEDGAVKASDYAAEDFFLG